MTKPQTLKDWQNTPSGSEDRREIPAYVFYGPNRTYPAYLWDSEKKKWRLSERMLRAIISRANSQGQTAISARASRELKREFGGD